MAKQQKEIEALKKSQHDKYSELSAEIENLKKDMLQLNPNLNAKSK